MTIIVKREDSETSLEQTSSRRCLPKVRKITSSCTDNQNDIPDRNTDDHVTEKEGLIQEMEAEIREQRHDINNLITVIIGTAEIIGNNLDQGQLTRDELKKALHDITQVTITIKRLLQSPLASLERAKNNIELHPETIDILKICEQIQSLFPGTDIDITATTANTVIEADNVMILRVLYNIIQNAIKFSENENAPVVITIEPESEKYLTISIRDYGPGLTDESEKLFASGYRSASTSHLEGSGLGLAFCKKAVTYHKGEITAENNEDGFGATFTVKLPYKQHRVQVTKIK